MFIDFILLWSISITFLKLAMKNYISVESAAVLMMLGLFVVATTRIAGSNIFRERSRVPKFFLSLMLFALSVADGDIQLAVTVAIWTSALPICLFGLYICFRSAFGKM
jgi:hypothetical protein